MIGVVEAERPGGLESTRSGDLEAMIGVDYLEQAAEAVRSADPDVSGSRARRDSCLHPEMIRAEREDDLEAVWRESNGSRWTNRDEPPPRPLVIEDSS